MLIREIKHSNIISDLLLDCLTELGGEIRYCTSGEKLPMSMQQHQCSDQLLDVSLQVTETREGVSHGIQTMDPVSPISHHTGATSLTLSDHTIVLIAVTMDMTETQKAKLMRLMFQDRWTIMTDRGRRTRMKARMFTIGTSGNVGSMLFAIGEQLQPGAKST